MIEISCEQLRQIIREEIRKAFLEGKQVDELMSRKEAAKLLGIKPQTLAIWASQGRGPAPTKIGSCVRYKFLEIQHFISENTMPR